MHGISRSHLTKIVQTLGAQGLLETRPYREQGARVRQEYRLSPRGQDLGLALIALMQWGDRHLRDAPSRLAITDRVSGAGLQVALVKPDGRAVPADDVVLTVLGLDHNT